MIFWTFLLAPNSSNDLTVYSTTCIFAQCCHAFGCCGKGSSNYYGYCWLLWLLYFGMALVLLRISEQSLLDLIENVPVHFRRRMWFLHDGIPLRYTQVNPWTLFFLRGGLGTEAPPPLAPPKSSPFRLGISQVSCIRDCNRGRRWSTQDPSSMWQRKTTWQLVFSSECDSHASLRVVHCSRWSSLCADLLLLPVNAEMPHHRHTVSVLPLVH